MLLDRSVRRIATKELSQFFASPIFYLFLVAFVAVMLYLFFWVETFFARNIADIRPLFQWIPVILIFLASALTMRMWSEEQRTGTIEFVMTLPVPPSRFVLGKFYACLLVLLMALACTLPLPVTLSFFADLDWGPVLAAYMASVLLGGAYISIGLFVSARSNSQIVSLVMTVLLCAVFNLLGSPLLTDFFGIQAAEWLRLLGSGSRFESIERGVIDLRDLYYYLSISIVFLLLNAHSLEKKRWSGHTVGARHLGKSLASYLLIINVLLVNVWLFHFNTLRADVTRGQVYSLSEASRHYLQRLQEPLLLRGYFSSKTHPLLAPLVPQIKDLLKEYQVAGQGSVRVDFVDPLKNPELEDEANKKYGIKPVPLQVTDKYQASLVNSYFNILVQYGDQYEVLGFRDLIEVKAQGETDIEVRLRNPEYDITRAIKKALFAYQAGGDLFTRLQDKVQVNAYISDKSLLPPILQTLKTDLRQVLAGMQEQAEDKLQVSFIEPEQQGGAVAQQILEQYGFKPMTAGLLDPNRFYFYVTLESGNQIVQIPLPAAYKIEDFQRSLESGLKRFASGFLKTLGLVVPETNPYMAQLGMSGPSYKKLRENLSENLTVKDVDLNNGTVPGDIDILMLVSPENLDQKALFALDQYLMKGGTLVLAASPFSIKLQQNQFQVSQQATGLEAWLRHHGVTVEQKFVMDPQNASFPVPVTRNAGGFTFQEIRMLDYPYFIDVRDGLNTDNPITADLNQLTISWAAPISIETDIGQRQVTPLVNSSEQAWLSDSTDIMPRISVDGKPPFEPGEKTDSYLLGMIMQGQFSSYFKDKSSPLLPGLDEQPSQQAASGQNSDAKEQQQPVYSSVVEQSPTASRIILFSSDEFIEDQSVGFLASASGSHYVNTFQLMANTIDWAMEDSGLLSIRARGHFNRTLPPMEHDRQQFWEYLNYILALLVVVVIAIVRKMRFQRRKAIYQEMLNDAG